MQRDGTWFGCTKRGTVRRKRLRQYTRSNTMISNRIIDEGDLICSIMICRGAFQFRCCGTSRCSTFRNVVEMVLVLLLFHIV